MKQQDKIICIFGGAGFIGRRVTQDLARAGYRVKIATRIPESAFESKTCGNVGQVVPFQCNYSDEASLKEAISGSSVVINLVGILFEKGKNNKFERVHTELPASIAKICAEENVQSFVHISALGIEESKSKYAKSKLDGEARVFEEYPTATILRPSVVFGPGDSFFNMFAKMATFLPFLPLIGGGKTKFQPIYVGDIAQAITNIVTNKTCKYKSNIYHLGGPEVVTFKEIYQILLAEINRDRALVTLPWGIAKIQGSFMSLMPKPLLTRDQVKSLETDNVVAKGVAGLKDLGVEPTAMGIILPKYLSNFKKGGRFANKNAA